MNSPIVDSFTVAAMAAVLIIAPVASAATFFTSPSYVSAMADAASDMAQVDTYNVEGEP